MSGRQPGDPLDPPGIFDGPEPDEGAGLFTRLAAPGAMLFGLLCGVLYAFLIYEGRVIATPDPSTFVARAGLAFMFVSGGLMGLYYFVVRSKGRRTMPLVAEISKLFFALWTLVGLTFAVRVFSNDPLPEQTWAALAIYFLVGTTAGVVWMFGLILAWGIRRDIGSREVIRFPVWVADEVRWVRRKVLGR